MSKSIRRALVLPVLLPLAVQAATITQTDRDPYRPLSVTSTIPSFNMLVLERDYKLWMAAYNDASALLEKEADGSTALIDVGYKGYKVIDSTKGSVKGNFRIDYYGLFDSYKCYTYSSSSGMFSPSSTTTDKTCSGKWSGDFLNYMTTSRMDALSRVLYGGNRYTDTATSTVLQRAYIPSNSNTWGKEYTSVAVDGYDISKYTPLSVPSSGKRHLFVNVTQTDGTGGISNAPMLKLLQDRQERIWEWTAKEVPVSGTTIDNSAYGGGDAVDVSGSITSYTVRVEVCKSGMLEDECVTYTNKTTGAKSYKPTGLLQQYGSCDRMRFGLLTGSYSNNDKGGVLRKNIGLLTDEIKTNDGTFNYDTNGIIATISKLRLQGWANDSYGSASWVYNPLAEMLYETMRYYSGAASPTSTFKTDTLGAGLTAPSAAGASSGWPAGLPEPTWTDPYAVATSDASLKKAKPFITVISDVTPSKDGDNLGTSVGGITFDSASLGTSLWTTEFGGSKSVLVSDGSQPVQQTLSSFNSIANLAEEPRLGGTYKSVMVGQFGRNNGLISTNTALRVGTYAVALSSPNPTIEFTLKGRRIVVTPFAKSTNGNGNKYVGFFIDKIYNVTGFPTDGTQNGGRPIYKIRVSFSDTDVGSGDDDMDAIAYYTVSVNADQTFTVVVDSIFAAGGGTQHMGYAINGTNTSADKAYLVVRDCDTANLDSGTASSPVIRNTDENSQKCNYSSRKRSWSGNADTAIAGLDSPPASGTPTYPNTTGVASNGAKTLARQLPLSSSKTFTVDSSSSSILTDLKNPLWYLAKYGGPNQPPSSGTPDSYFLVNSPLKLKEQLSKAFADQDGKAQKQAQVGAGGVSSSSDTGTIVYEASYVATNWSGNLTAYVKQKDTGALTTLWSSSTSDKLLTPANRVLLTTRSDTRGGVAFEYDSLSDAQKALLNKDGNGTLDSLGSQRVSYLRGSKAQEGLSSPLFRSREQIGSTTTQSNYYGDILDSSPYYISGVDPDYRSGEAGFSTFGTAYSTRTPVVYFGANAGVFHGLNATQDTTDKGKEMLGYVPNMVYSKLSKLTSQSYGHEYYVNSRQASVNDVQIENGWSGSGTLKWSTLAVSAAGFGAKGLFALDVTSPSSFSVDNASKIVRWEFTSDDDADMGYMVGIPLILKTNDGKFRVITGNGYNSTNGKAVLYLLDASGPSSTSGWTNRYVKIDVGVGDTTDPNGLSAPSYGDLNILATENGAGNGAVDVIYAGDLYGNVWKFDLRSSNPNDWGVAKLNGVRQPLFSTATYNSSNVRTGGQPIIAAPVVLKHPTQGTVTLRDGVPETLTGVMVMFGTGKFLGDCDVSNTCAKEDAVNSFYGIWDQDKPVLKSKLLQRTYKYYTQATLDAAYGTGKVSVDDAGGFVYIESKCDGSDCVIDWTTQSGWYMNLVDQQNVVGNGTRLVGEPRYVNAQNLLVFDVMNLASSSASSVNGTEVCSAQAVNTVIALNYADGGSQSSAVSATVKGTSIKNAGYTVSRSLPNGSRSIASDMVVTGVGDTNDAGKNYGIKKNQGGCSENCTDATDCRKLCKNRTVTQVNWREIIQ